MDFDAVYFGFLLSDIDPAGNLDFWLSSGAAHFRNPHHVTLATEWEARLDQLVVRGKVPRHHVLGRWEKSGVERSGRWE